MSFVSSSWCEGLAAASDSGTPWTFLLTFYMYIAGMHTKLEHWFSFGRVYGLLDTISLISSRANEVHAV